MDQVERTTRATEASEDEHVSERPLRLRDMPHFFAPAFLPWGASLTPTIDTLGLLAFPGVFSQNPLMPPDEFIKAAEARGFTHLRPEHLLELHRRGALIPIYQLVSRVSSSPPKVAIAPSGTESHVSAVPYFREIVAAAVAGRLIDPATRPFRPWMRSEGRWGLPQPAVFYSPYQLIGLRELDRLCQEMTVVSHENGRMVFQLKQLSRFEREALGGNRQLATVLSALDISYWPTIVRIVRNPDVWDSDRGTFDVASRLAALGAAVEDLARVAGDLLFRAHSFDPMGDWYELIRLAQPDSWQSLKGLARLAMDLRMAAEILLLATDDLGRADLSHPPQRKGRMARAILDDRLGNTDIDLDEMLTSRGLSPFPSLVLVLEGKVEMTLMPRVIEEVCGQRIPSNIITYIDLRGVDRDPDMLIRYLAVPKVGAEYPDFALLICPATHILVAVDQERRYLDNESRSTLRDAWVKRVFESLPSHMQTDVCRGQIDRFVEVTTWGGIWEFANFTVDELGDAVLSCSIPPAGCTHKDIIAKLRTERDRKLTPSSKSPDVELFSQHWPKPIVKMALAEALWPKLQTKVRAALDAKDAETLPALRVALQALNIVGSMPVGSVAIRTK